MYYFKESVFLFVYSLTMSVLSLATLMIENVVLSSVLAFASIAFYLFIMFYDMMQAGTKAQEQLYANDTLRRRIVETGDDISINRKIEYKPIKGFLIGAFSGIPTVFFLLIHLIVILCGGQTLLLGGISNFLFMVFSAPVLVFAGENITQWTYFIVLYGVVLSSAVSGLAYIFGSKKSVVQHERILAKQRSIYGE